MSLKNIAIVGATGAVGEVMLELLAERKFPVGELYLLASERSAGTRLPFKDKNLKVEDVAQFDFHKVDKSRYRCKGHTGACKEHPYELKGGAGFNDMTTSMSPSSTSMSTCRWMWRARV